jgi:maltose O-acetyltransferase
MRSQREKMLAGELYDPTDPELVEGRLRARKLLGRYNTSPPDYDAARRVVLEELFGRIGADVWIEPPFYCDYGTNIELADKVYANFNCVFLDVAPIRIGASTFLGPSVSLYTACHPIDAKQRTAGREFGKPITIGSRVWLGGSVVVVPGVSIGDDTVIGAGSVVTKDIRAGVLAAGNPCRVIRKL